jgi:hypothetical protein
MWERAITIGASAAAPIAGLLVRGTRRHRLQAKIGTYSQLATSLDATEPEAAQELRGLVGELVSSLVKSERKFLRRQFDPGLLTATVLLTTPALVAMVWAWGRHEWWKWGILLGGALWVLAGVLGNLPEIWKAPEDEPAGE